MNLISFVFLDKGVFRIIEGYGRVDDVDLFFDKGCVLIIEVVGSCSHICVD